MTEFKNKTALITGGNSGIGFATARLLREKGVNVIITGRSEERVKKASESLGVKGMVADVLNLNSIDRLVKHLQEEYLELDILFVNAGIFSPAPIGSITEEMFDEQMGINFKGAVFTIEKMIPILKEGASIINLSSVNAYTGMPNTAIYASSKAAMNAYTRTAAIELASRKIRINAVNPGPVSTPIFGKTGMPEKQLEAFAESMQNKIPLKRFGQPEEIASLVSYLASDEASFITGSEFNIDGGVSINSILS